MPPVIESKHLLLERQAERFGECKHLVIVAAMRTKDGPDALGGSIGHARR
jgi:hypothetical protein